MNNIIKKAQDNIGPSPVVIPNIEKTVNDINEIKNQISNSVIDFMMTRIQYAGVNSSDFVLYIKTQLMNLLNREQDSVWGKLDRNRIPQIAKIISDKFSSSDYFNALLNNFKSQHPDTSLSISENKGWTYSQWGSTLKYLKARAVAQYNNAIASNKGEKEIEAIKQLKQAYFNQINVLFSAYNALYSKASETPGFNPNTSAPTMSELQNISKQFGTDRGFGGPGRNSGFGVGGRGDIGGVSEDQIFEVLKKHPFLGAGNRYRDFLPIKSILNAYQIENRYPTIMSAGSPTLNRQIWQEGNIKEARTGFDDVDFAKYVKEAESAIKEIIRLYLAEAKDNPDKRQLNEANNYLAGISRLKANAGATREENAEFTTASKQEEFRQKISIANANGYKLDNARQIFYRYLTEDVVVIITTAGEIMRCGNVKERNPIYQRIGSIFDQDYKAKLGI